MIVKIVEAINITPFFYLIMKKYSEVLPLMSKYWKISKFQVAQPVSYGNLRFCPRNSGESSKESTNLIATFLFMLFNMILMSITVIIYYLLGKIKRRKV